MSAAAVQPSFESANQPTGVPLDPVENISNFSSGPCVELEPPKYHKGMYREQYRAAARDGIWGKTGATCGTQVIELWIEDVGLVVRPVLCDCWACKLCGPRKAAWLIREIKEAQEAYHLDFFVTLTIWTKTCTPEESFKLVKASWNRLRTNLVNQYGKFSFVWTVEQTKKGYAHLHLLMSLDVDPSKLSRKWQKASGGSWITKVEPVESERAGTYLAKYCSQQARQRAEPGNEHLVGQQFFNHSRDVQFGPFRVPSEHHEDLNTGTGEIKMVSDWVVRPFPYWEQLARHKKHGLIAHEEQVQGVPHAVLVEKKGLNG